MQYDKFVQYDKFDLFMQNYVKETFTALLPFLKTFFTDNFTHMTFKIVPDERKIFFQIPDSSENARVEFVEKCSELIEKVQILAGVN